MQSRGGPFGGHEVSSDATRAEGGNGRAPGEVPGALAEYKPPAPTHGGEWTPKPARRGFDTATSRLSQAGTTEFVSRFENADGSFTSQVHQARTNFKGANGSWRAIDTNLVRGLDGRWRTAANSTSVTLARGTGPAEDLASVAFGPGQVFGYSLQGAALSQPAVQGSVATYLDALADTDVQLAAAPDGLKETLILKSRSAANSWVFPLRLQGLTASLEANGSVTLRGADGTTVAAIPAGYMQDAQMQPDGDFTTSNAVTYDLITVGGIPALKITADRAWLDDPSRVYPVKVDPSATTWDNSADVYVDGTSVQDVNSLGVGCYMASTTCDKRRSFLKFGYYDYAYGAPGNSLANVVVTSASLKLFHTWSENCTQFRKVYAHRVTQSWSPSSMPNGAYPGAAIGASSIGELLITNNVPACNNTSGDRLIGNWWTMPITDLSAFRDWSRDSNTNYGIALKSEDDNDRNGWKRFTSRDSANSGQNAPYLELTWEYNQAPIAKAIYPPNGSSSPTLTPELMVWASDPDGWPNAVTCQFLVTDPDTGNTIAQSTISTSDRFSVPAGVLQWSKAYAWTVILNDGKDISSTTSVFTTGIPQAPITSGLSQNADKGFSPNIGNYTTSAVDAQIPTVGPALSIARSYNSRDPRVGRAFGSGWSSILDARATEITDAGASVPRLVVITYPTGQDVAFGRSANGSFISQSGRFSMLRSVSGGYELTDKEGTKYAFTAAKGGGVFGLTSVADAQGRTLTLTYTGANVTALTAASGRRLTISWTGGHVNQVTDEATNAWTYMYSGEALVKVCPPTSSTECSAYEYGVNSQYPTAVLDAGPHTYLRLNEAPGEPAAKSSAVDNPDFSTGSYSNVTLGQTGPLPSGTGWTPPTAAGFNGSTSSVSLQKKAAWSGVWMSVSLWFKTTSSGVLYGFQNTPLADSASSATWTPALYVDTNGYLRGELWTGYINTMVSPSPVNNNVWHQATLTASGNLQEMYLDGVKVGQRSGGISDHDASNIYIGAAKWSVWPGTSGTVGYFNGSIAEFAYYTFPLRAQQVSAAYAASNSISKPLTKVTRPSGGVTAQVVYDAASGAVTRVTDANNGVWQINPPTLGGSSVVHTSAVLAQAPADYFRLTGTGNEVNGGTASFNLVTLGVSGGPFADSTVASFNGTQSNVQLPIADVAGAGPASVSLWFKTTGSGVLYGHQTAPLGNPAGSGGWNPTLMVGTDGKLRGKFWTGNATPITSAGVVNNGTWHHVVLAASTSSQTMYLDGQAVGTLAGTLSANGATPYLGAGKWTNWQGTSGDMGYFTGQIAEFAFYRSEVKAEAVKAQFAARDKAANQGAGDGVLTKTIRVTDPGGVDMSYVYDLSTGGRQVRQIDARGGVTTYGYDVGGFLRSTTDPNRNISVEEHDVRGNVIAKTTCQSWAGHACSTVYTTYYPDAVTKVLTPDARNDLPMTSRDGRSQSSGDNTYLTSNTYDIKGNLTAVTDPLGRVTRTDYTDGTTGVPAGLPTKVTSPNGAVETSTYNAKGEVTEVVDKAGLKTQFEYDPLGRLSKKTVKAEAGDLVTLFAYDQMGRVTSQTDPTVVNRVTGAQHTAITTTVYDADGRVLSKTVTDSTGGDAFRKVENTYNALGQLVSTKDAAANVRGYTHDAYGNKVTETDPSGTQMAYAYDATGQLVTTTVKSWTGDPNNPSAPTDLVAESRAYDPGGRLASVTDAMGWVTEYKYYDNGLTQTVTRKDPSNGASFVAESYEYDAAGNTTKKITGNGTTAIAFVVDAASRTTSQTVAGVNRTTTLTYGLNDTVTSTKVSDGTLQQIADSAYDLAGRKVSETVSDGSANALVARWRLNESAGVTAKDGVGNSAGALSGGASWASDATRGQVAHFDGTGKMDMASPVDASRAYSVSAWVRLASKSADAAVAWMPGATGSTTFEIAYQASSDKWLVTSGGRNPDSTVAWVSGYSPAGMAPLNTWTHLAATVDPGTGTVKLFVNGTLQATGTAAAGVVMHNQATAFALSSYWGAAHINGDLSDIQVYQKALSASDITAVYNGTAPVNPVISRTSWTLDKRGLQTSVRDANGNVTTYAYDEAGQLAQSISPSVLTEENGGTPVSTVSISSVGYNTFGEVVENKDAKGNVTTTARDANGQAVQVILPPYTPPGSQTTYNPVTNTVYDTSGQVIRTESPNPDDAANPRTTSYVYDQLGRTALVTAPNGGQSKYTYTLTGQQLSVTDANGARSEATYDYLGRKVTTTAIERSPAASYVTTYAYDSAGRLASVTPQNRNATTYQYNVAGETTSVTDAAGYATQFEYDFAGRKTATIAADLSKQTAVYDPVGRPVTQQQLSSGGSVLATTSSTYDAAGHLLTSTDARGNTISFTYDESGLVTQSVQPVSVTESITTSFGYDATGKPTRFTDGRGNKFVSTYNTWGLTESEIEPDGATFTTVYDVAGQAATRNAPGGVTVSNAYNKLGQLTGQTGAGADAATASRSFTYDPAGRLTSATEGSATTNLSYNDRGLLTSTSGAAGSSTFTWTSDGLMASRQDAAGTSTFGYNSAGQLSTVSDASTGDQATFTSYNPLSQPNQVVYGTGNRRTFTYDNLHRLATDTLSKPDTTTIASIGYGYDANGNETSKTTSGFAGAGSNTYTYDKADRLTSWNNGTSTVAYQYDASGNRTMAGSRVFTYDWRNQLTSDGNATYTYTPRGTLAGTTEGTVTTPSSFDAYGQQISHGTRTYAYDGLGRVLTASGGQTFTYTGTGNDLAADGTATYSRGPGGGLVGVKVGSSGVFAWTDLHTDVVGQFTATGTGLAGSRTYNPFGTPTAQAGLIGNLGYQSGWTDPLTSRVNMHARWYNPDTGQFASRDTVSMSAMPNSIRANRFAYGDGNPLTVTDPTGHCGWCPNWLNKAASTVSSAASTAWSGVKTAWNATTSWVGNQIRNARDELRDMRDWVRDKYKQAKDWAVQKINETKERVKQVYHQTKQAIVNTAHKVNTAITKTVNTVVDVGKKMVEANVQAIKDAYKATADWVVEHKAEIAGFVAGAVVGIGCGALIGWTGVGAVACGALAGAVGSFVTGAMQGHTGWQLVGDTLLGAVTGAVGGAFGGAIGGKIAAGLLKQGAGLLTRVAGGVISGAVTGAITGGAAGGIGGALSYGLNCRPNCSLSGLGSATLSGAKSGAITGGITGGVFGGLGGLFSGPKGCHSFDPKTFVLMANGSAKAIKDVKLGDKVVSTDPATGKNADQPVTALHRNLDVDLVNVTVATTPESASKPAGAGEGGRSTRGPTATVTLQTTDHHPFWDVATKAWVNAVDLETGKSVLVGPRGQTLQVVQVQRVIGFKLMRDLTVANVHTYYVLAGATPVLVHNCISAEPGPAPANSTLRDYRNANTGPNAPRFVTEYTSPNGNRYYGRTTPGGVDVEPGSVLDDVLRGRHTGCSEVCALNEAQKAGDEIFGGSFSTLKVNTGEPVEPCVDRCQPMIRRLQGIWAT